MRLTVGKIGAPSGIRGDVRVQIRTDNVELRFAKGNILQSNHPKYPKLTVETSRKSGKHFVVHFKEITDRNQAEELRAILLEIDVDIAASEPSAPAEEEDSFYPAQLRGLKAFHVNGQVLGTVKDLILGNAQDILLISTTSGEVMVPFVSELVPVVNLSQGLVRIDPPDGLFTQDVTSKTQ